MKKDIVQQNSYIDYFNNDHTFGVRTLAFLAHLFPKDGTYPTFFTGPMDEEEFDYICYKACDIIKYQIENVNESNRWYFENLVKGFSSYIDIVKWCCEFNENFYKYLINIKAIKIKK